MTSEPARSTSVNVSFDPGSPPFEVDSAFGGLGLYRLDWVRRAPNPCAHGVHDISVPTGHRTISPGVRHKVNAAIEKCRTDCKEN